ncbi:hypothetical protein AAV95_04770 [Mycolicibacterium elephantis]|nr:hypothetical protein AAV95_04770 [Mycolicibacterium elephantis]
MAHAGGYVNDITGFKLVTDAVAEVFDGSAALEDVDAVLRIRMCVRHIPFTWLHSDVIHVGAVGTRSWPYHHACVAGDEWRFEARIVAVKYSVAH